MQTLGLHIEGKRLMAVSLSKQKKVFKVCFCKTLPLTDPAFCVKELDIEGKRVFTGISSQDLLIRELSLSLKSKRALLAPLPFQAENLFPFPENEIILAPLFHPRKEGITPMTLLAA